MSKEMETLEINIRSGVLRMEIGNPSIPVKKVSCASCGENNKGSARLRVGLLAVVVTFLLCAYKYYVKITHKLNWGRNQ